MTAMTVEQKRIVVTVVTVLGEGETGGIITIHTCVAELYRRAQKAINSIFGVIDAMGMHAVFGVVRTETQIAVLVPPAVLNVIGILISIDN